MTNDTLKNTKRQLNRNGKFTIKRHLKRNEGSTYKLIIKRMLKKKNFPSKNRLFRRRKTMISIIKKII